MDRRLLRNEIPGKFHHTVKETHAVKFWREELSLVLGNRTFANYYSQISRYDKCAKINSFFANPTKHWNRSETTFIAGGFDLYKSATESAISFRQWCFIFGMWHSTLMVGQKAIKRSIMAGDGVGAGGGRAIGRSDRPITLQRR